MPYIIDTGDPIARDQSKHVGADGSLRYNADGSEVFPGATGVRTWRPPAVATLDEAREAAKTVIIDGPHRYGVDSFVVATYHLSENGGTIGPLPDGTTIHVERVSWAELNRRAGKPESTVAMVAQAGESNGWPAAHVAFARTAILDTFNGRGD